MKKHTYKEKEMHIIHCTLNLNSFLFTMLKLFSYLPFFKVRKLEIKWDKKRSQIIMVLVLIASLMLTIGVTVKSAAPSTHYFRCSGYIKTTSGVGISGATVKMYDSEMIVRSSYTTSASGYYSVSCYTSDYTNYKIEVTKDGYITQSVYRYSSGTYTINFNLVSTTCSISGYVHKDHSDLRVSSADVKLYSPSGAILRTALTNSEGYFNVYGSSQTAGNFRLVISKSGYDTITKYYSSGTYTDVTINFMITDNTIDKLAYFFYPTSEQCWVDQVANIATVMQSEGFSTTTIADEYYWKDRILDLDILEGPSDFVFIYAVGHGSYSSGVSRVNIGADNRFESDELDELLDNFESEHIFVFIDSCYSGGFVNTVQGANRFVISSTDCEHVAYYYPEWNALFGLGSVFTNLFFSEVLLGYSDTTACIYAITMVEIFFSNWPDGPQCPMYNDQEDYTWFFNW
ncbi:MAG: hypothetical protein FK734_14795 [Asgard group archaeon]|nr:hypothetical protein [Asgard group archaeon]